MTDLLPLTLSAGGVLISIISFLFAYFNYISKLQERIGKVETEMKALSSLDDRMIKIERCSTKLETQVGLIWGAIEQNIAKILHSPTHKEKDILLDKLPHLTTNEAHELKDILTNELSHHKSNDPRVMAYALLIARVDAIIAERKEEEAACK